ncbi:MAG: hypothetical protein OXC62_14960, partial [Aestuariivita sp.]|nr:hypothetical protein [Aestuariivita sp.]
QLTALPIPTPCPHVPAHPAQGAPRSIASTDVRTPACGQRPGVTLSDPPFQVPVTLQCNWIPAAFLGHPQTQNVRTLRAQRPCVPKRSSGLASRLRSVDLPAKIMSGGLVHEGSW